MADDLDLKQKRLRYLQLKAKSGQTPQSESEPGFLSTVASDIGNIALGVGEQIREGAYEMPKRALQSGAEMAAGTPYSQTPSGQYDTSFVENAPKMAEEIVKPYTNPIDSFQQKPVTTALAWSPALKPLGMATTKVAQTFAGPEANFLERVAARSTNRSLGIPQSTIEEMTPRGSNPARVGVELGRQLGKEGLEGKTAFKAGDIVPQNRQAAGQQVGQAIKDIKANNPYEWENRYNMLHTEANSKLRPILEKAAKLEGSKYPEDAVAGKWYRAAYDSLAEKANANNGYLTLDHITDELQHIGDVIGRTSEANMPIVKKIYGQIANLRDQIVEDVASSASKPELAENLRSANAKFSRYARIEPDVRKAAAKTATSGASNFLSEKLKTIDPLIAKGFGVAGRGVRNVANFADKATDINAYRSFIDKIRGRTK